MTTSRRTRLAAGLVLVALVACSGDDDAATSTSSPSAAADDGSAEASDEAVDADQPASTETAPETTELRAGVVAFEGSVESLIVGLPEARNFAEGVEEWLDEVPGQEGVFRNSRGITVFVPVDEGFSAADRDDSFADPDTAAITIGDHLHVGAFADLTELDGSIVVATGVEYQISDDGETIGGRRVLRSEQGTNGVVIVIDGPLNQS